MKIGDVIKVCKDNDCVVVYGEVTGQYFICFDSYVIGRYSAITEDTFFPYIRPKDIAKLMKEANYPLDEQIILKIFLDYAKVVTRDKEIKMVDI